MFDFALFARNSFKGMKPHKLEAKYHAICSIIAYNPCRMLLLGFYIFHILCFNDNLLEQLVKCHVGFDILNMNVCCLTVAGDIVIMALSITGLALILHYMSCMFV